MQDWLPTTKKEVERRGWNELDVILISGDGYVDHPAFGHAVVAREELAVHLRRQERAVVEQLIVPSPISHLPATQDELPPISGQRPQFELFPCR